MSENSYRRICAIVGLLVGVAILIVLTKNNVISSRNLMIPGAILGATGAVVGGIAGEKLFARKGL